MAHRKRLIRTFAYICTHTKDWHQGAWRCNSGMCFAGHAAVTIAGREPLVPAKMLNDDFVDANDLQELVLSPKFGLSLMMQERIVTNDSQYEIPDALKPLMRRKTATMNDEAREYLGLTSQQAGMLFAGENELPEIARLIGEYTGLTDEEVIAATKAEAKANGWRWPRKELRERFDLTW